MKLQSCGSVNFTLKKPLGPLRRPLNQGYSQKTVTLRDSFDYINKDLYSEHYSVHTYKTCFIFILFIYFYKNSSNSWPSKLQLICCVKGAIEVSRLHKESKGARETGSESGRVLESPYRTKRARATVSHFVVAQKMCDTSDKGQKWKCEICTYENYPSSLKCTMCQASKPLLNEDIFR